MMMISLPLMEGSVSVSLLSPYVTRILLPLKPGCPRLFLYRRRI